MAFEIDVVIVLLDDSGRWFNAVFGLLCSSDAAQEFLDVDL